MTLSTSAVLNLWSAAICLVVSEQRLLFDFLRIEIQKQTNLTIFHGTIFGDGPRPRDKICKWLLSLKRLRTATSVHISGGLNVIKLTAAQSI